MPYLQRSPNDRNQAENDGGEPTLPDPALIESAQKGIAYRDLLESEGYKRILDFMEARCDLALRDMREAVFQSDGVKMNLLNIWTEREAVLREMELEISRGISEGAEAANQLSRFGLLNVPIDFNHHNNGENS